MGWLIEDYDTDDHDFNVAFHDLLEQCEDYAAEHGMPVSVDPTAVENVGFRLTTRALHVGSNLGRKSYKGVTFNAAAADGEWFINALMAMKDLWYHIDSVNGSHMAIEIWANRNEDYVETMPKDEYRLWLDFHQHKFYAAIYLDEDEPIEMELDEWLGIYEQDENGIWYRVDEEEEGDDS